MCKQVVDEVSAALHIKTEQVFPLERSNYKTICKFEDDEDQLFGPVGDAFGELVYIAEIAVLRESGTGCGITHC